MARLETTAEWLSANPYLLGENFSVADAYLFVTLGWGNM
jgi:glutathione S-transferase